jgi:mannose-6-phosphate isomerase class I
LVYTVYAENRSIKKEWTIKVHNAKNPACDFLSFSIPGFTKSVNINTAGKSILIQVNESADLRYLHVQFDISPGASAWIGQNEQFSNTGIINFSGKVQYQVLAEDGINSCIWTVTVQKVQ